MVKTGHKYKLNDVIEIDYFQSNSVIGIITELRPSQHYAIYFPFSENKPTGYFNRLIEQSSRKLKRKAANSIRVLYGK